MDHTAGMLDDDSVVLLMIEPGNGQTDMSLYVPESNFLGALSTDYLYFYTYHGAVGAAPPSGSPAGKYGAGASFEEWGVLVYPSTEPVVDPVIPEPATMAGLVLAVGALVGYVRRRR